MRQIAEGLVRNDLLLRRNAALQALGRVSLTRAIEIAREAGTPEVWRWLWNKLRDGSLPAWGTVGRRSDQRLEPAWLDHEVIFGWPELIEQTAHEQPTDDCIWFEPGDGRPRRLSDIAVDAASIAGLLSERSPGGLIGNLLARGEAAAAQTPNQAKPRKTRGDATRPDIAKAVAALAGSDNWENASHKERCRLVDKHLGKPDGWCKVRTLGRAIADRERAR